MYRGMSGCIGVVDVDVERVIGTPGEYPFSRKEPMVIRAKEQLKQSLPNS